MSNTVDRKPEYKIGDVVFISDQEIHEGRIQQGVIESAELIGDSTVCWFYGVEVPQASVDGESKKVFTYGGNCGDANSKIVNLDLEQVKKEVLKK